MKKAKFKTKNDKIITVEKVGKNIRLMVDNIFIEEGKIVQYGNYIGLLLENKPVISKIVSLGSN